MFNLDEALAEWRDGLSQNEAFREEDGAELEAHLREQMAHLNDADLTEEEAFRVAAFRMGDTARLACEFGKVNGDLVWKRRLMWMVGGVLGYLLSVNLAGFVCNLGFLGATYLRQENWATLLGGLTAAATVWLGVVWFCFRFASGKMPGKGWLQRRWQRRWACATDLAFAAVALLALKFACLPVQRWAFRLLSFEQFRGMAMPIALAEFAWPVALPVILMVIFYRLWSKRDAPLACS